MTGIYEVIDGYVVTWGDKMYFVSWTVWAACATDGIRRFYKYYAFKKFALLLILDFINALAFGNLVDELFFKPTKVELGEYIGAIVGLLVVAYQIIKRK